MKRRGAWSWDGTIGGKPARPCGPRRQAKGLNAHWSDGSLGVAPAPKRRPDRPAKKRGK